MDWYYVVLRVVHIVSAVFWAGSALLFFFFIEPSTKALGATGDRFMGHVLSVRRMPFFVTWAAGLTVVAGILLYWRASGGFEPAWITSPTGMAFTIGGAAATTGFLLGMIFIGPSFKRMARIGASIEGSGVAPSPEQSAELERLATRVDRAGRIDLVLIVIAVLTMAVARAL